MDFDEQDIAAKLQLSDANAFESLFHNYYQPLCLFANRFLNDIELSKECVSDTFSQLWEKRGSIVISTSLRAYLHRSVQNRCLNLLKRKKIENRYVDFIIRNNMINDPVYQDKITDIYYDKQLAREVQDAIEHLPDRCREIFCLNRFDHLSYKQIAEKLSIAPKTVENQMGIALSRLKTALEKFLLFFPVFWG